jgi:hypothetical protein
MCSIDRHFFGPNTGDCDVGRGRSNFEYVESQVSEAQETKALRQACIILGLG